MLFKIDKVRKAGPNVLQVGTFPVFSLWIWYHIFISDCVSKPFLHVLLHKADEMGLLEIITYQ